MRRLLPFVLLVGCGQKSTPPAPDAGSAVAAPVVGGQVGLGGCTPVLRADMKLPTDQLVLPASCGNVTVEGDVVVNAKLTVEPGVTVSFAEGASLTIAYTEHGALIAVGEPGKPVVFTGVVKKPGSWKGISLEPASQGSKLLHVVIEYAGAGVEGRALHVRGSEHSIGGSTFRHGEGTAILADDELVAFAEPVSGNRFEDYAVSALRVHPRQLSKIGSNHFSGQPPVELLAGNLELSATMFEGVIYRLLGAVIVQRRKDMAETPILTVEPGALVEAAAGASLSVAESEGGSLRALGEADRPVVFSGVDKKPGSWKGIHVYGLAKGVLLQHTVIEYAEAGEARGALHVEDDAEVTLDDVSFRHLPGYGLSAGGKAKLEKKGLSFEEARGAEVPRR